MFDAAIQYILDKEGRDKITDDPKDPGGLTKWGVSLRAYPNLGRDGVKNLTEADAITIYRRDYWDSLKCDQLPPPVAFCVLDCAINQGQPTAAKILQRSLGMTESRCDGVIGPATIELAKTADIKKFTTERIIRYTQAPGFMVYRWGWISRALETFERAMRLS